MSRNHFFITLTPGEKTGLSHALKAALLQGDFRKRRRLQAVWFSGEGKTVQEIAKTYKVSERIVWKWLKAYKEKGVEGLKGERFFGIRPKRED